MDDIEQATAAPGERRTAPRCDHADREPLYARNYGIPVAYVCNRCGAVEASDDA